MSKRSVVAKGFSVLGLGMGLMALGLQFSLTIPSSMAAGRSFWLSVGFYFSFFTILTNIAAVLVHAAALLSWSPLAWFRKRTVAGGVTTAMLVVMIVYHFLLSQIWAPQGWFLVCDKVLHYVLPAIILMWWALTANGQTRFATLPFWLIYPMAYLIYAFVRYSFVAEMPYPFLDPKMQTPAQIATVSVGICALFVVAGFIVVAVDRWSKPVEGA